MPQVLIDNIKDFAPVIYTPTVGLVCQNYGGLFRRPRGMYFSAKDKGEMMSMIYNWPSKQVNLITAPPWTINLQMPASFQSLLRYYMHKSYFNFLYWLS